MQHPPLSLLVLLLAAPAGAIETPEKDIESDACERVEGDTERRERNAERRLHALLAVEASGGDVQILHADPGLREPATVNFGSIELDAVRPAPDGRLAAHFDLSGDLADACGDGLWLEQDDSLGRGWQVARVLRGGVLLLGGDKLLWVARQGAEVPEFRLVWRSPTAFDVGNTVTKKKNKKKNKKRKKRKKRR